MDKRNTTQAVKYIYRIYIELAALPLITYLDFVRDCIFIKNSLALISWRAQYKACCCTYLCETLKPSRHAQTNKTSGQHTTYSSFWKIYSVSVHTKTQRLHLCSVVLKNKCACVRSSLYYSTL